MIKILGEPAAETVKAAEACYKLLGLEGDCFLELDYVTDDEIRRLNAEKRNIDRVTDVLSFPYIDSVMPFTKENYPYDFDDSIRGVIIGSVAICLPVAAAQAKEYGHSETRECTYLFVHGLLHVLGYDHMTDEDKSEMRKREEEILGSIGVTR